MAALAGIKAFVHAHAEELPRIVLEVHLEHAAAEFSADENGDLVPTGEPEPRLWFTTRLPHLERIVREAVTAESLDRSLLLPPDALAPRPPTDGGHFHPAGVPLVNFLTAPFYLFDAMDTLEKVHRPSLVPITRAAIRMIHATRGVSAAAMRQSGG